MWYRFDGIRQADALHVAGYVAASTEDVAYDVIRDRGVVPRSLCPARKRNVDGMPFHLAPSTRDDPSPSDGEAQRVSARVASPVGADADDVADPLPDRRPGSSNHVARRDAERGGEEGAARPEGNGEAAVRASRGRSLEDQIERLLGAIGGVERVITTLCTSLANGVPASGPARSTHGRRECSEQQNAALLEIFESNVELRRQWKREHAPAAADAPSSERGRHDRHGSGNDWSGPTLQKVA